jgi:hypothetical protein
LKSILSTHSSIYCDTFCDYILLRRQGVLGARLMTQKQFATRKVSLGLWHPEQSHGAALSSEPISCLSFGNNRGVCLLVRPATNGAAAVHHRRGLHISFCSVTTSSAAATSVSNDGDRSSAKAKAQRHDALEPHSNGQPQGCSSLERLPVAVKKGAAGSFTDGQ